MIFTALEKKTLWNEVENERVENSSQKLVKYTFAQK